VLKGKEPDIRMKITPDLQGAGTAGCAAIKTAAQYVAICYLQFRNGVV
jgi:hypothetical protein